MKYTEHYLGEYIDGIQRCVICGEIIHDYTNVAVFPPHDTIIIKGWKEGEFYISEGNPSVMWSIRPVDGEIVKCNE